MNTTQSGRFPRTLVQAFPQDHAASIYRYRAPRDHWVWRTVRWVVVAAVLALLAFSASAGFYTGNELHDRLASDDAGRRALAMGYVAGAFGAGHGVIYCPPDGVTLQQVNDVVKLWLVNNPQHRNNSASMIVAYVISQTWPCKSNSTKGINL